MSRVPKEGAEVKTKSHAHRRRWRSPFIVGVVAAGATFLLAQFVITLIEELPKLLKVLK